MKRNKKSRFLRELENIPIVQTACEKIGISRNTVYRWKKEDPDFSKEFEERMEIGGDLVSDVAESHLLKAIQKGESWATRYWLSRLSKKFRVSEEKIKTIYVNTIGQMEIMRIARELYDIQNEGKESE